MVICLDSGCGNYEQLWSTTSLRGLTGGTLTVEVMKEGIHLGDTSGIVPSSFRLLRQLLDRLEDADTGKLLSDAFHVAIPARRIKQAERAAKMLDKAIFDRFPTSDKLSPIHDDPVELILNRSWRPALSYAGIGDMPDIQSAGNVLRPKTSLKLSMRLPQEGIRYYIRLKQQGVPLGMVDVGGRLGVDYEGTSSNQMYSIELHHA